MSALTKDRVREAYDFASRFDLTDKRSADLVRHTLTAKHLSTESVEMLIRFSTVKGWMKKNGSILGEAVLRRSGQAHEGALE